MKRLFLLTLIVCAIFTSAFAQDSLFVSASGNDSNSGTSEAQPFKTLSGAFSKAIQQNINKITVIGTLDVNSEGRNNNDSLFQLSVKITDTPREILISGKTDAAERAVLSGAGSGKLVLSINNDVIIRLENIEISSGEGEYGAGLYVNENAQVTIGPSTVIKSNSAFGILVSNRGTCIIDGGEIRENNNCGVFLLSRAVLTMNSGIITENKADVAAGVYVSSRARFEMNGGTITENRADSVVGGVLVDRGGTFRQQRGASVAGNYARNTRFNVNVHRM